jgi:hypothetical protein
VATNVTGAYDLTNLSGFTSSGLYGTGPLATEGPGSRLVWYPGKAAFRAGNVTGAEWDDASIGQASVALGYNTTAASFASVALGESTTAGDRSFAVGQGSAATGPASFAAGVNNTASGFASVAAGLSSEASAPRSVAIGGDTTASGFNSTALGGGTTASGEGSLAAGIGTTAGGLYSMAMGGLSTATGEGSLAIGVSSHATNLSSIALGEGTTSEGPRSISIGYNTAASGQHSIAMGQNLIANADFSVALGGWASANGMMGSFVFGDSSQSVNYVMPTAPNQFVVRAAGGATFYTSFNYLTGVELDPGGGAWDTLSDARMKTNFVDLDGEDVLRRLRRVPIRQWNYISQDASMRHVGPTAQDFHAAFGLGGDPRRISTLDPDGISLKAIQALDARSQDDRLALGRLTEENTAQRERIAELERQLAAVQLAIANLTRGRD